MGIFDKILSGLGFESENKQKKPEKEQKQENTVTHTSIGAKYDLSEKTEKQTQTLCPNNQVEVQNAVDVLKKENAVIVDLAFLSQTDFVRALDFLSGAVYFSGGKIQKISDKKFFICVSY